MEIIESLKAFNDDPYLVPFQDRIESRTRQYGSLMSLIGEREGGLHSFSRGTGMFGLVKEESRWIFREYLPSATEVHLVGDFNCWNHTVTPLSKESFGRWSVTLPLNALSHGQKYKLAVKCMDGRIVHRVPAWANYVVQNPETNLFDAVVWDPPEGPYIMKNSYPSSNPSSLKVYEAHVGMSGIEPRVSSYNEFRMHMLPRIKRLGYNTVQLMAIPEHAYYGSFGYHVTSFFAPSSRFGTPDDLRELIDTAHGMGITVLMDIVHAHMSGNHLDGIACMDGTDFCYTHAGALGKHELWDSALFDYSKWEVLRFLLSNVRYWIEDIGFDGFRFDGITSMLYKHHGIGYGFSGDYNEYFGDTLDMDACVYLMMANQLVHTMIERSITTIAEDVSGMPLLCRPVSEGGFGFDYRLAMAIPDMWIKLLKEQPDQDWNMGHLVHTLTNRRWNEKTIAYCESHDQAIVGDKTIAMWLLDADIYSQMNVPYGNSITLDRGIALHKMIRLISSSLGNNGYLTFMGNEFGHPEWIDFPREGNNWSYHLCRRRWDLTDCGNLRFSGLEGFDAAMIQLLNRSNVLEDTWNEYVFVKDETLKLITYERGQLLFVFNFHVSNYLHNFPTPTRLGPKLRVVLDSDEARFGGHGNRINHSVDMLSVNGQVSIDLPPRCALVLSQLPLSVDIIISVPLSLVHTRYKFSSKENEEFNLWQELRVGKNRIVEFSKTSAVKVWFEEMLPYGVHAQNEVFSREQAFEFYLSGNYNIDEVGRLSSIKIV